ncbi:MAG: NAD-glutamate dehydrogenase domain-containing protein, partial [Myxococcota bacterium]
MTSSEGEPSWATDEHLEQLTRELTAAAQSIVSRVIGTMPPAYFNDTDKATLMTHLKAIIAAETTGQQQEIRLRNEDGTRFTFIHERSYRGQLAQMVRQLPKERPLLSAKVHTAADGGLVLDVFEFDAGSRDDAARARLQQRVLDNASNDSDEPTIAGLERHLSNCDLDYLMKVPEQRIREHARFLGDLRGTEETGVSLVERPDSGLLDLRVGTGRVDTRLLFEQIAAYLGHRGFDIQRAYLNRFEGPPDQEASVISLLVRMPTGGPLAAGEPGRRRLEEDLLRIKWLDNAALALAHRLSDWSLSEVDTLVALSRLTHQVLHRRGRAVVAGQRVLEICERHADLVRRVMFAGDPAQPREGETLAMADRSALESQIKGGVDGEEARRILRTLVEVCQACRATNVSIARRYASCFDVDPQLLAVDGEEAPFGVYFIHGRDFDGFHVRFRDIARGGLRLVRPRGWEQHTLEVERLYQEAYGLAFAQQLKNKDIPEGGSKGVILTAPGGDTEAAGRAYADALLDLLISDPRRRVYLGPDENVSNDLIFWIVNRAAQRGYAAPNTFMSSKPGVGINHKEHGVTSEGLTVFLEVALRHLGIDPRREECTVKLTGGPDGDVAGNQIRILHREYGGRMRIVGIADGSGSVEDPRGLDYGELLRLTQANLPISRFDRRALSSSGQMLTVDEPGGLRARDTLHNRVHSHAFIPAGGRPRTIHEGNWRAFFAEDGTPSSRLIVEGANLFLTPLARDRLSERGVLIIKDSSANKCGVVCSSFEILASMLWSEDQFLTLKSRFVAEVIEKLRELARLEAELLFEEHLHRPAVSLQELSLRISRIINRAADAIAFRLRDHGDDSRALAQYLVATHLPRVLVEEVGDRLLTDVPAGYLRNAVATVLASRIVYREGLAYLEEMP